MQLGERDRGGPFHVQSPDTRRASSGRLGGRGTIGKVVYANPQFRRIVGMEAVEASLIEDASETYRIFALEGRRSSTRSTSPCSTPMRPKRVPPALTD